MSLLRYPPHLFTPCCASTATLKFLVAYRGLGGSSMALRDRVSLQTPQDVIFPTCFFWDDKYSQHDILRKNYIKAIFLSTISGLRMSHSLPSEELALLMRALNAQYNKNPAQFSRDGE